MQNPREPFQFYRAHLGSKCALIAPDLRKDLGRGCTEKLPLPGLCGLGLRGSGLCMCPSPPSLLRKCLTSDISYSWVTCKGWGGVGCFTFFAHFRAWGSTLRHIKGGRMKEGVPLSPSLLAQTETVPLLTSVQPGSQPFFSCSCSGPFLSLS